MESLHVSFQGILDHHLFSSIELGSDPCINVSHLFYADDVVFMGEWTNGNICNIVRMLHYFHLSSSLNINLHKSKLLGIAVGQDGGSRRAYRMFGYENSFFLHWHSCGW